MAPILIAILSLTVLGIPFVLALDREASPLRLLGLAFLYGAGAIYVALLALSVLHVQWTLLSVTIAAVVMALPCLRAFRTRHSATGTRLHVVDAFALITPLCLAVYATVTALWEWDFWAIWGLKARVFLEHGGIDWRFLESRWNVFAHPDYPLLVPFVYDFAALVNGEWSDRWLGLLFVAWALSLLLVARDLAGRETTPLAAGLIAFVISCLGNSRYVGLAEGALIAYLGAGVLFVRRAVLFDDDAAWRHGAVLLGLAACTKNEGLAVVASVAVAIVVTDVKRWRRVLRLWPAVAIVLPWLVLRALHDLPTDVVSGSIVTRLVARLPDGWKIIRLLVSTLDQPWLWVALLFGIAVVPLAAWKRERFVLTACFLQIAVYAAVYFSTPHNPGWHILTSWPRLTAHVAPPLAFAVMIELARHAEARSEQQ
jgi:hypothetical protein